MEPGTGKTLTTLDLIVDKYNRGKVSRVLVIGPKVALNTWIHEVHKHVEVPYIFFPVIDRIPYNRPWSTITVDRHDGTGRFRYTPYANPWPSNDGSCDNTDPLIVTYVSTHSVATRLATIEGFDPDVIVLDESHMIKKPTGKNHKAVASLSAPYRYMLTGTPTDRDRHELWGQFNFCYPELFSPSFKQFTERWCSKKPIYGAGGKPIPHIFRYEVAKHKIKKFDQRIKPYCFVATKKVLGLRDPEYIYHDFDMPPKLKNMYDTLKKELVVEYEGGTMIADSIAAEMMRLQQLTSGVAVNDEGEAQVVDTTKFTIVKDLINLHQEPAVVFCRFTKELQTIKHMLMAEKLNVVEISGKVKGDWRSEWDVVVAQVQAGGMSIDLTRSRHLYFISRTYSYVDFFQCMSRVHRSGQDRWVKIWSIEAKNSIDKLISQMIQCKESNVKVLFDLLLTQK